MFKKCKASLFVMTLLVSFITSCQKSESDISTSDRDKFLGTWKSVSTGSSGIRNFNMTIIASNSAPEQIIIKGFDGGSSNSNLPANVSAGNVSLVSTVISGETISGSGSLAGDTLRFNFTVDDGQTLENRICKATK